MKEEDKKAYIVAVDMGYGHQRALYPFLDIGKIPSGWNIENPIISANNYPGIPKKDSRRWEWTRMGYELISRLSRTPIIGRRIFKTMDHFQKILPFYPKRDLSKPTTQLRGLYRMIKKGFGKHLIDKLNENPLPLLTSFFGTAFFAEEHGYKGEIYCLCTDSDVSRTWAPMNPSKSRIIYLAPNRIVRDRLIMYGVWPEKIVAVGFPLPKKLLGERSTWETLRHTLGCRIGKLDPDGLYQKKYERVILEYLGKPYCDLRSDHPITITFAVGGAGAQWEIGIKIMNSLCEKIRNGEMRLNLIAGTSRKVYEKFLDEIRKLALDESLGKTIHIVYHKEKLNYFDEFTDILATTDVLWTKPSELSFYVGLGIPIIMSDPLGSQEEYNRSWIHSLGAGIGQRDPEYVHEWFFDWLNTGWFAKASMSGFLDAPKNGTYHIEDLILRGEKTEIENIHLI